MSNETFTCGECRQDKPLYVNGQPNYGLNQQGERICFECCGKLDEKEMKEKGRTTLYLSKDKNGRFVVGNWPGTLKIPVMSHKESVHNIAGNRTDVWFKFNGYIWHGYQIGNNSQLCHCKQTKEKVGA